MRHDHQHEDATRSEPPQGATREEWIKAMLKAAYRGAGATPINSRITSDVGLCLSDRFTDHLEVLQWVKSPPLTERQVRIIELIYRDDRLIQEVAARENVRHSTIARERHDALETLIRIAWDEPDYHLPYRVYSRNREPGEGESA